MYAKGRLYWVISSEAKKFLYTLMLGRKNKWGEIPPELEAPPL